MLMYNLMIMIGRKKACFAKNYLSSKKLVVEQRLNEINYPINERCASLWYEMWNIFLQKSSVIHDSAITLPKKCNSGSVIQITPDYTTQLLPSRQSYGNSLHQTTKSQNITPQYSQWLATVPFNIGLINLYPPKVEVSMTRSAVRHVIDTMTGWVPCNQPMRKEKGD